MKNSLIKVMSFLLFLLPMSKVFASSDSVIDLKKDAEAFEKVDELVKREAEIQAMAQYVTEWLPEDNLLDGDGKTPKFVQLAREAVKDAIEEDVRRIAVDVVMFATNCEDGIRLLSDSAFKNYENMQELSIIKEVARRAAISCVSGSLGGDVEELKLAAIESAIKEVSEYLPSFVVTAIPDETLYKETVVSLICTCCFISGGRSSKTIIHAAEMFLCKSSSCDEKALKNELENVIDRRKKEECEDFVSWLQKRSFTSNLAKCSFESVPVDIFYSHKVFNIINFIDKDFYLYNEVNNMVNLAIELENIYLFRFAMLNGGDELTSEEAFHSAMAALQLWNDGNPLAEEIFQLMIEKYDIKSNYCNSAECFLGARTIEDIKKLQDIGLLTQDFDFSNYQFAEHSIFACIKSLEVVGYILNKYRSISEKDLMFLAYTGNNDVFRIILTAYGDKVGSIFLDSLICRICRYDRVECIEFILNIFPEFKSTMLFYALKFKSIRCMQWSLKYNKVDINEILPEYGETALMIAVSAKDLNFVQFLLDAGADVNIVSPKGSVLSCAAIQKWNEGVEFFLSKGVDINLICNDLTVLEAAKYGYSEMLEVLFDYKANVDAIDNKTGETALMIAVKNYNAECVDVLLKHGANVDAIDNKTGETALMIAVKNYNAECVDVLLKHGANVDAVDAGGNTVKDVYNIAFHELQIDISRYASVDDYFGLLERSLRCKETNCQRISSLLKGKNIMIL